MTNENLTSNLNYTGIFLELAFLNFLKKYPHLGKETQVPYTITYQGMEPINGAIDFLCFFCGRGQPIIYFIIECKKADPSLKSWVFFKRHEEEQEPSVIFYRAGNNQGAIGKSPHTEIVFPDVCDRGFQVVDSAQTKSFKYEGKDPIYAAAIQANTGLVSVIRDEKRYKMEQENLANILNYEYGQPILYVPIVVTTANLYICDVDGGGIDMRSGEAAPNDPTYKPVEQVEYSVPIPEYLQVGGTDRRSTFIVNSQHLEPFFNAVITRLRYFYLPIKYKPVLA